MWQFAPADSEVRAAAIAAVGSPNPAVWRDYIDAGVYAAKYRDEQIAKDREAAANRLRVARILDDAVARGQKQRTAAARAALAGDAATIAEFLRAGQFDVGPDVLQMVVTNNRIGMLTADGIAYVSEGGLRAPWVVQYTEAEQLVLAGNRIGVLTTDGTVTVREGGLEAVWDQQRTDVRHLVMASTAAFKRIGILRGDNVFQYKDGALTAAFRAGTPAIAEVAMTGPRIATLLADGSGTVRSDTGGTIPPQLGRIAAGSSRVTLDTGRICHVGVRPVPDPGRPRLVC